VPYEYLEHTADVAIGVRAASLEEMLCDAARGLFSIMVPAEQLSPLRSVEIVLNAGSVEMLLVDWLAELLAQKDLRRLLFCRFAVTLECRGTAGLSLRGTAWGEPLDRLRHAVGAEAKGISHAGLLAQHERGGWVARFVVDV